MGISDGFPSWVDRYVQNARYSCRKFKTYWYVKSYQFLNELESYFYELLMFQYFIPSNWSTFRLRAWKICSLLLDIVTYWNLLKESSIIFYLYLADVSDSPNGFLSRETSKNASRLWWTHRSVVDKKYKIFMGPSPMPDVHRINTRDS